MKNISFKFVGLLGIAVVFLSFAGCDSDKVDNYYTFTGETMGQYIEARPETYSEFYKCLDTTNVIGLLKAYGDYTCFAPSNSAMEAYYTKQGVSSYQEMSMDSLKKLVYDHIIKDFEIHTEEFGDGFLSELTMSGRYLKIGFAGSSTGVVYSVNDNSTIITPDIMVHNGVIHEIDKVLAPTENNLVEAIAQDEKFTLFYQALMATGLDRELLKVKDDSFVPDEALLEMEGNTTGIGSYIRTPRERKFGYTALMESDETYAANGINTLDDLAAYASNIYDQLYPEDAGISDITDRKNSLNRFIAYHLINKKIPLSRFIEAYDNTGQNYATTGATHSVKLKENGEPLDLFEYIETMCPNTLMEVRTLRNTNEYNIFNMLSSGEAIRITDDFDNDALNGVYHEIDGILAYTPDVEHMLTSKRLRIDAASFFPELTNNNIRVGCARTDYPSELWKFPKGYFDRVTTSETTTFGYFTADERFLDFEGDEIFLNGLYDFEITTPPIPAGTYEVRFGYKPETNRGAAQLYWDGVPVGIPLDLRLKGLDPKIGFEAPGNDPHDPEGFENDKMMRNRGYMKAPAVFQPVREDWYSGIARYTPESLRKILGIYTFDETGTHNFKVIASRSGEFMFDYLEFVPTEVLEHEDIY